MAELAGTKDPQRWERAAAFYRVIEAYAEAFVAVAIELEPINRAARDAGILALAREVGMREERLTNPYILAHRTILDATLQYQRELGIVEPIDFIFDRFGQERIIRDGWELFAASRPPEFQALLGRQPRFESDDDFLPLQAADMIAWHAREHWLKHGSLTAAENLVLSWKPHKNPRGYRFNLGYPDLLDWFQGARQRGIEAGIFPRRTFTVSFSCDLSDPEPQP
jgi:hypothetical protein